MNNIKKIDKATAQAQSVEALSNHPNAASRYGTGGKSPSELKRRYDALAWLAIDKINELLDAIGSDGASSELLDILYTGFADEENEDKRITLGRWIILTDAFLKALEQRFAGLVLGEGDEGKFARVQGGKWQKFDGNFIEETHKAAADAADSAADAADSADDASDSAEAASKSANEAAASVNKHDENEAAHKEQFNGKADANYDALAYLIGEATGEKAGLMSAKQAEDLAMLLRLLFEEDGDNKVNTIKDMLDAFEGLTESSTLASLLSQKLSSSHANSSTAHSSLFAQKVSTLTGTNFVYANRSNGTPAKLPYTASLTGSTVPYRNSKNLTFRVGDPVDSDHPVTKGWFERKVRSIIGDASTSQSGLMTKAQVEKLNRLVKLENFAEELLGSDLNILSKIDLINELLAAIDDHPDGADIMDLLAGKVDKIDGDGVYATEGGDDLKIGVSDTPVGGKLARRVANGGVAVPLEPQNAEEAASKQYVDIIWNALTYGEWGG